jgi:hypothetical protein
MRRLVGSTLLTLFACAPSVAAQENRSITIPHVTRPPELESFISGVPREAEATVTDFVQREPGDGVAASQKTMVHLSYDDTHLYVVFVCEDREPRKIRARVTRREQIFGDDVVGLLLDTFYDKRRFYIFLANPLGIQLDGITSESSDDDYSYDALWRSEGRLTSDGYVVLMAIPFRSLRFPRAQDVKFSFALGRIIPRANETSFWPYITRRIASIGQQVATMEGLRDISPGRNMQAIPYGAFASARTLDTDQALYRRDDEARGGVDAKFVVRDAFTVDVAGNPDFSQVESDEPQVTINRRFEVFFPEKRPFFIENSTYFQTPQTLFFSRRIGDPQFGIRVSGQKAGWAVGALAIDDRAPGQRVSRDDRLFERRAAIGVVRLQRDLPRQSNVGLIVTSRDFGRSRNRVGGVDTRIQLSKTWIVQAQAVASRTHTTTGEQRAGPAYNVGLVRPGRNLFFVADYTDRSPGFHSDVGFIPRVDMRELSEFTEFRFRPKNSRLLSYGPALAARVLWNHAGVRQDQTINPGFSLEFPGQTRILATTHHNRERFQGIDFHTSTAEVSANTQWLRWLELSTFVQAGSAINFVPAPGLQPFEGRTRYATTTATLRPTSRLRVDQTYIYNRLAAGEGAPPASARGATVFTNHLLRSKIIYQFTRELSVRAILDYNAVLPDSTLVSLARDKRLTADLLATYLINPWTAVYVGYTDGYANLTLDPLAGAVRRTAGLGASTARQLFIKTSYLLRW